MIKPYSKQGDFLVTPCPFKQKLDLDKITIINVGTVACKRCKHHREWSTGGYVSKNYFVCKLEERKKKLEAIEEMYDVKS